jgi:shikimate kinase
MNIILIGMTGVGKSTIGKLLAKEINYNFIDIDRSIENNCGVDISTIFAIEGEDGFRYREHEELTKALNYHNYVIATGGGIITRNNNFELFLNSQDILIYLTAELDDIIKRVNYNLRKRPLLDKINLNSLMHSLYVERSELYKKVATIVIDTTNSNIHKTVTVIINELKDKYGFL